MEMVKTGVRRGFEEGVDFCQTLYRDLTTREDQKGVGATFTDLGINVPKGTLHPLTKNVVALVRPNSVRFIDLQEKTVTRVSGEWLSFSGGIAYIRRPGTVRQASLTLFDIEAWKAEENKHHTSSEAFLKVFTKGAHRLTVSGNASRLWDGDNQLMDVTVEGLGRSVRSVKGAGLYGNMVHCWRSERDGEVLSAWTTVSTDTNAKTILERQTSPSGTEYIFGKDHIFTLKTTENQGFELACYHPQSHGLIVAWEKTVLERGSGSVSLGSSMLGSIMNSWRKVDSTSSAKWVGESSSHCAFTVSKGLHEMAFKTVEKSSGVLGDTFTYDPATTSMPIQLINDRVVAWRDGKIVELKKGDAPLNKMPVGKRLALFIAGVIVTGVLVRKAVHYLRQRHPTIKPATPINVATPPGQQWVAPTQGEIHRGPLNNPHHYMNRGETW